MTKDEFEALVGEIGLAPIPEKFHDKVKNVAFVIEDEPSADVRAREGLSEEETLLGLYHGVPLSARGDAYGVGPTFPDVITIYYLSTIEAAEEDGVPVREIVEDTIRHEIAHYLGMDEAEVRRWEAEKKLRS